MANRATPGPPPEDPLQEIRQSVVAIGTLVDPPPLLRGQLFYDGSQVNFEVRGTGFIYSYTPLAFAKGKSDPDPKTGTVYYWAQLQRILENASRQPQPLRKHLLDMARLDRSARAALAASGTLFNNGYEPRMARIHQRNAQHLWRIIESVGWPGADLVGSDGAEAAWLILQHAIAEPDLLRRALPLLTNAAREGKADPAHAAMLEDRIRFFEGRPQRYGTQLDWDADGSLSPGEVDDPQNLAARRDAVGLPPLEEQIQAARSRAAAEGERPPADYQAYEDARNNWASKAGWRAGL